MSDFDLSLIREFRRRPAFYDRNSPLFKDKACNAQAWQEISNTLGYDVALLKDRMLQLRNRYNLEKRRLEQLAEEHPEKATQHSPWPLYEHLGFLSEHIRSRRSFKRMQPRQTTTDLKAPGRNLVNNKTAGHPADPFINGLLTVKLEHENGAESESQSMPDDDYDGGDDTEEFGNAPNHTTVIATQANLRSQKNSNNNCQNSASQPPPTTQSITIRSLDTMRTIIPRPIQQLNVPNNNEGVGASSAFPQKKHCSNMREQKYQAFGHFVASSLVDMPKQQALMLVEKFTSELVRVAIEKTEDCVVNAVPRVGMAGNKNGNNCR